MKYFVGIDWAEAKHDVCVIDENDHICREWIITDDQAGFTALHTYLQSLKSVCIVMERQDGLLADFLIANDCELYVIPPMISAKHRPRRGKTDRADAYLLAHLLKQGNPDCRLVIRHSPLQQHLKQVVNGYDKLSKELQRLALQMRYHLRAYYPAVLSVFRKPQQFITYAFLEAFPDPHQMPDVSLQEFTDFFTAQSYNYMQRVATHLEVFQKELPTVTDTQGFQIQTSALVAVMKVVSEQLRTLRKEMVSLLKQHPDYDWLISIPGLGDINASRLLVRLGDNRNSFKSPDILRATAGTVPITQQSGKHKAVLFRKECSHPLRKAFFDLALHSRRQAPWAKAYYDAQRARGHAAARANRALANRWVGIVWKLWQNRMKYDAEIHRKNRVKHQQDHVVVPKAS